MKFLLAITISLMFGNMVQTEYPNTKDATPIDGVKIGEKAPFFNLKNIDGEMYSFDNIVDAKGNKPKGYIIIFTCNTCPVAKANESRIIDLHAKYSPQGYPVVAIQPNDVVRKPGDNFEAMQKNAKEKGFEFLYLIDNKQEIYPQYGATKTPEVYLADENQIVRYHGAIDDSARDAENVEVKYLENAIEALKAGDKPEVEETKAIGCGIKGKKVQ